MQDFLHPLFHQASCVLVFFEEVVPKLDLLLQISRRGVLRLR